VCRQKAAEKLIELRGRAEIALLRHPLHPYEVAVAWEVDAVERIERESRQRFAAVEVSQRERRRIARFDLRFARATPKTDANLTPGAKLAPEGDVEQHFVLLQAQP